MDKHKINELKPINKLLELQSFVFGLIDTDNHKEFSSKLCNLHEKNSKITGEIQDKVINSKLFLKLSNDDSYKKLAVSILKTSIEDIKIISPFFRIDLPSKFESDHKRISLPWHQEAGYYLKNGNCTPNSIVLSTYLHTCKKSEGAIEISIDPRVELYNHSSKFLDNYKKKFLRVTCPTPKNYISVETNFGEVVIFDFLRPHRSGLNKSSLVRLTYLKRATSILDLDKWNYKAKKYILMIGIING